MESEDIKIENSPYRETRFSKLERNIYSAPYSKRMMMLGGLHEIVLESRHLKDNGYEDLLSRYLAVISKTSGSSEDYVRMSDILGDLLADKIITAEQYDETVRKSACNRWL